MLEFDPRRGRGEFKPDRKPVRTVLVSSSSFLFKNELGVIVLLKLTRLSNGSVL